MKKIKFRGKRKNNGEWVEGYIVCVGSDTMILPNYERTYNILNINISVIPETVGQFTGYIDKNEKEIFEGDIVKVTDVNDEISWACEVETKGIISVFGSDYDYTLIEWAEDSLIFEVIGNKFDNPELINA